MDVDSAVIQKHRRKASAYETYPSSEWFVEAFGATALDAVLTASSTSRTPNFAIDLRLPTSGLHWTTSALADIPFLLRAEIDLYGARFDDRPTVDEMRVFWNDAIPITPEVLMHALHQTFDISPCAHLSVVIDPLAGSVAALRALRGEGFSRIEINGGNDSVGWRATEMHTLWCVALAHELGLISVGASFAYGLPGQSQHHLRQSVAALIASAPSYICIRNVPDDHRLGSLVEYAHKDRSTIRIIRMLITVVELLSEAGYECIGQDLYALPSDPLTVAHHQGRLLRKPHGLSLQAVSTILAIGPGALGATGNTYYQNHLYSDDYRSAIARGALPVMRGTLLGALDLVRGAVIQGLTANMFVDLKAIEAAYLIDFRRTFSTEMQVLGEMEQAGLLLFDDAMIELTQAGRLIANSIAMIFDKPLRDACSCLALQGSLKYTPSGVAL